MPVPAESELTFNDTIGPLFKARCGACHSSSQTIQGLDLSTYQAAMEGGDSGLAILPGDPDNSLIILKQTGEQSHFGQLTPEELELLIQWIQTGAPE
jgi:mono/diheme cytochrome c family protein